MLDEVLNMVTETLVRGGVRAVRQFPKSACTLNSGVCVSVGVDGCRAMSPGLGDYLGLRREQDGKETEIYGKRLELELGLEIFSPFLGGGADDCVFCADSIDHALLGLGPGIRVLELRRGEVSADEALRAFRCRCSLICTAFFIAEGNVESTQFLDFVLKGTVDGID